MGPPARDPNARLEEKTLVQLPFLMLKRPNMNGTLPPRPQVELQGSLPATWVDPVLDAQQSTRFDAVPFFFKLLW